MNQSSSLNGALTETSILFLRWCSLITFFALWISSLCQFSTHLWSIWITAGVWRSECNVVKVCESKSGEVYRFYCMLSTIPQFKVPRCSLYPIQWGCIKDATLHLFILFNKFTKTRKKHSFVWQIYNIYI